MALQLIDMDTWERREFYEHFISEVVCTYSAVVNMDITNLKGQKLYPAMIWLLTKTVNDMPEFRTSLTPEGLGIYDDMHPMYTVFNLGCLLKNCKHTLIRFSFQTIRPT